MIATRSIPKKLEGVDLSSRRRVPDWVVGVVFVALLAALITVYVPGDWRNGDVALYHIYALGFWSALAHPLLPVEYPPLSVVPFGLSLLGPQAWYPDVFAFWMAAVVVIGFVGFRHWTTHRQAIAYLTYGLAAGVATLIFRFDMVPALLAVGALWLAERRRFRIAYGLIALATLMKIFPALLIPVVAISEWNSLEGAGRPRLLTVGRGVLLVIGAVALGFALAAVVDPKHAISALTYDINRPDEVESIPATVMWLAAFMGVRVTADAGYGSFNLVGAAGGPVNGVLDVVLVAGLAWTYWRLFRGRISPGQAAIACVLLLLCTSKVLSAQYLLWLVPLVASTIGFQARWLFLFLLTALVFPTLFSLGIAHQNTVVTYTSFLLVAITARNALLVGVTLRFLAVPGVDLAGERKTSGAARAAQRQALA